MAQPRVPGGDDDIELPCGETVTVHDLDLGLREYACDCGERHAVVMDVHPLGRFVPEFLADAIVREEFPDRTVSQDVSEDGSVGYSLVWLTDFDSRRLHEVVVELLVELMDHAVSHADDAEAQSEFQQWLAQFDVTEFVDQYRAEREFESEHDSAV
ncbi:hypothetical protein BRC74_07510 [Halobacteriales archaeon QH_7_68_42]|nr:MAG: hypothetical protein BRC74_07510 [Halobacteriales archaeon QH_7_68_42]